MGGSVSVCHRDLRALLFLRKYQEYWVYNQQLGDDGSGCIYISIPNKAVQTILDVLHIGVIVATEKARPFCTIV